MADAQGLTGTSPLDLEVAIGHVVNGDSDDFFELARTLELNPLTDFEGSDLSGITLQPGSSLEGANLRSANLEGAVLAGVLFIDADLSAANLSGADLNNANLKGANFTGAHHLTVAQVKAAREWQAAHYDPEFRDELGLSFQAAQPQAQLGTQRDQVILAGADQLRILEEQPSDTYAPVLAELSLDRQEPEVLYSYLLNRVRVDSPAQLTKRFHRLFTDAAEETDAGIQLVLQKISAPSFPVENFNAILNRCCYIILNRWAMRPMLHQAIPAFLERLESVSPNSKQPEQQRHLSERLRAFTQTEQFSVLKDLSQSMALLSLFPPTVNRDLNSPLGDLIQRYPYLYDNYFISRDSADTARQIEEIVRRIKLQKQQQFEVELAQYVTAQVQQAQNSLLVTQAVTNPTLLNDQELVFSLKQFSGNVAGSHTEKDLAASFLAHSSQLDSFAEFKDELYQYLTSAVDFKYGKHSFNRQLRVTLQGISPQHDSQRPNEQLLVNTCRQLLNFLIVESKQPREHYVFLDLLNNVGPTLTIRLLLKIVLLCHRVKPYLEQRFFLLFDHYRSQAQGVMQWLIECLENLLVALTTNFSATDFSPIKLL
jgi:hypothetical protein